MIEFVIMNEVQVIRKRSSHETVSLQNSVNEVGESYRLNLIL